MSYKSFDTEKHNHLKQTPYLGEPVNLARYDKVAYPIFDRLTEDQLSFFWRPEEIDVSKDKNDFAKLSDAEKHIFTSNLQRQILLDTVQGRCPSVAFLPFTSVPELETWIATWTFSETIHSRSYTHIIRNIINDPSVIFDSIMDNKVILKDSESITKYYDDFIEYGGYYQLLGVGKHVINGEIVRINSRELKKRLTLALMAVNILEGIRFYVSFICSWAFAENKQMVGNADIIKLISRDEALHLVGTQAQLRIQCEKDPEMADIFEELKPEFIKMFKEAAASEKAWAEYLFQYGTILGLNVQILSNFVEYITNVRMKAVGLPEIFPSYKRNPISWSEGWLNTNKVQVAPQESEITKYLIGAVALPKDDSHYGNFRNPR
jgi:ribonucleoside-diphosphate reductase beta chain